MGLFSFLGDVAKESYNDFKKDPAGNISDLLYSMNDEYEKKKKQVYEVGERKARQCSDDELRRYSRNAQQSGNKIAQEIAQREMNRRGL